MKNHQVHTGLTFVELLVSMAIALFLVAGVAKVMSSSKTSFHLEQEASFIQENARYIIDELSREIRMAGYYGCNALIDVTNTLDVNVTDANWMYSQHGIKGFEEPDATKISAFSAIEPDTDVVIINRGEQEENIIVVDHNPSLGTIELNAQPDLGGGALLVVADAACDKAAIFQAVTVEGAVLKQDAGGAGNPGNCHRALSTAVGGAYTCDVPPETDVDGKHYRTGSSVMSFQSTAYYIKSSDTTGMPTLYQESLKQGKVVSQELVSGVEDLEIIYGLDSSNPIDGVIDRYYRASDIKNDIASGANGWLGWDRVVAVRMTFILRSSTQVHAENTKVDLGEGFVYNDRYMRQKISTTTRIRNRGLSG